MGGGEIEQQKNQCLLSPVAATAVLTSPAAQLDVDWDQMSLVSFSELVCKG